MAPGMIHIVSRSYADDANTNAQNLTVREIARRFDPERFHITLFASDRPDPRLLERPNVRILTFRAHGKAIKFLSHALFGEYAVNFYVRNEWVDTLYLRARSVLAPKQVAAYHVVAGLGERRDNPRDFDAFVQGITWSQVVACNSKHVADTVQSRLGRRLPVIRNGVDFGRFHPTTTPQERERPRILFVGSLQQRKRPLAVVEAAYRIPEADFCIMGSGPLEEEVRSRSRRLGNVSVLPSMPQAALANRMKETDVFLLTSSSASAEGAPQVLAQAAASGLPVISSASYSPEAVIDGETGFVVHNDDEMVEKLRLLVTRRELRQKMGEAGVRLAHLWFDWDAIVRQWEDLLLGAVDRVHMTSSVSA